MLRYALSDKAASPIKFLRYYPSKSSFFGKIFYERKGNFGVRELAPAFIAESPCIGECLDEVKASSFSGTFSVNNAVQFITCLQIKPELSCCAKKFA